MDNFLTLFDMIGVLARRRYQTAERHFSTLGLNHTEARLLRLLDRENGPTTQETLSNFLLVDRSNTGRALKSLEHEGYIERSLNRGDKRTNLVQITARGREVAGEISKLTNKIAQDFFGGLNEDEAGQIIDLLRKVGASEQDA